MKNYVIPTTKKTVPLYIIVLAIITSVIILGIGTLLLLSHFAPTKPTQQPAATQPETTSSQIATLKKSVTKKLEAGDTKGAIQDLQDALALAEKDKNQTEIIQLKQQIDFAQTTPATPAASAAAPQPLSNTRTRGYITR